LLSGQSGIGTAGSIATSVWVVKKNRWHRLLTSHLPQISNIVARLPAGPTTSTNIGSGGLPIRSFSSHGPLDGNRIVRSNNRAIFRETGGRWIRTIGHATEKLPSGAPCGFRSRLHQLGEALIPRGTKSSNPSPSSRESANLRFLRPPSHVERPVRVLVVRDGSMARIRARRPSWKALSEPRNSLRMAILPVWRSGCGSSTPPVHSRSRHLAGLCIRRLFGRAFTLIE